MGGLTAALCYLASAPAVLVVVGFTFFYYIPLADRSWKETALAGLVFGLVFHAVSLCWLFEVTFLFGPMGRAVGALVVVLYVLGLSAPYGLFALGVRLVPGSWRPPVVLAAGAPALVAWLSLVHRGALNFPWFEFGQWLLDSPLRFWISLLGAEWSGAILLGFAAALAVLCKQPSGASRRESRLSGIVCIASLLLASVVMGLIAPGASGAPGVSHAETGAPGKGVVVRVISLNYTLAGGAPPTPAERLGLYVRLTRGASADLVVWPESTADEYIDAFAPVLRRRLALRERLVDARPAANAHASSFDVLLGARRALGGSKYNMIYDLAAGRDAYRKRRLVPFTEFIPGRFFQVLFARLGITIKNSDLLAAPDAEGVFIWRGLAVYPLLCYESAYAELLSGANAPGFILNAGNETWFATEPLRAQTLRQARARAMETGLFTVRVTAGGYSGFIEPNGTARTRHDAARPFTLIDGTVEARAPNTWFARRRRLAGVLVCGLFALLGGVVWAAARLRRAARLRVPCANSVPHPSLHP